MEGLRIAIIDPVGKKAGLDHYDRCLAEALIKKSCIVKIYSNFEHRKSTFIINHFSFILYNLASKPIQFLREYTSALRQAKLEKTDIIIIHLFHASLYDFLILRYAKYLGLRICLIVHDVESLINRKGKSWMNDSVSVAESIIVHNDWSYAEIIKKISVKNKKKVHIIPHGNFIDLPVITERKNALSNFNLNMDKKYLLFFGMIKESKGLDILIEAMKNVDVGTDLIIAGRTRDVSAVKCYEAIERSGLRDRIHMFIRYITNEERNSLFTASDVIVLPYRRIYQSGVLIMAMSYGLTVVASDLSANKTMLGDGRGILFRSGDAKDLSEKINYILSDRDRRMSISRNAMDYVTVNHSWDVVGSAFVNVFNYR